MPDYITWKCDYQIEDGRYNVTDDNHNTVANVSAWAHAPESKAEAKANLAMILVAPDMLMVLQHLVDRKLIKDPENDHMNEVLELIAKAKGAE